MALESAKARPIVGRSTKVVLLLSALILGALISSPAPAGADILAVIDSDAHYDDDADCVEALPDGTSIDGATNTVSIDALILLDGPTLERGQQVMALAAQSYSPMHIALKSTFRSISVPATGTAVNGNGQTVPSIESQQLIDASRDMVGGAAPDGFDVVYTLTTKELADAEGMAECIGGVRYPGNAFAVGEDYADDGEGETGFLSGYKNATAKIAAHEIGHLMGAHHHYANCAEGFGVDDSTVCTLMFNYIDFQTNRFGTLESNVIRGHTEDFAAP
jgi:hypothetical protein